ncbi:MAG: chemotaxis protein CheX [Sedimentisphaerales bacterium]|jgi:chemotaxis protein CheX|nr:chemotaxis protein CheX [Sedimentisphaerales bacterium]
MVGTIDLAQTLLDAAKEVLGTMAGMEVTPACEQDHRTGTEMVLSSITFTGPIEGCLGVICQMASAKAIAGGMLAMEPGQDMDQQEAKDAMGEVANMVMGAVKSRLLALGLDLTVSIPAVVTGQDLEVGLVDGFEQVVLDILIAQDYPARLYILHRQCE